jgi:hypothetical protein
MSQSQDSMPIDNVHRSASFAAELGLARKKLSKPQCTTG